MCQAMYEYQVTRKLDDEIDEDELVCVYCGEPKGDSLSCCEENHFVPYKDML